MKKVLFFFLTCLIVAGCSLSASQEQKLNESISAYLFARNECNVLSYVAFTYPELVVHYKNQSDSIFTQAFDCNDDTIYLQDPTQREVSKENATIHVLYDLDVYNKETTDKLDQKQQLIAISNDNGLSWFFLDKSIYVDKSLLPNLKRLLDK